MNHPVGLHPKWVSSSETRCRPVRPRASQSSTSLSISFEEEMGVSVTVGSGWVGDLAANALGGTGALGLEKHRNRHTRSNT